MTIAIGDSLPDVTLTMTNGAAQSLASRKGRPPNRASPKRAGC